MEKITHFGLYLVKMIIIASVAGIISQSSADEVFRERPVDTLVMLHDPAQLNCTFYTIPQMAAWFKGQYKAGLAVHRRANNDNYGIIGDIGSKDFHLLIHNATMEHNDIYYCGDFFNTNVNADANLYVITHAPSCTVYPGFTVVAGEDTTFTCEMGLDDNAPGDVVWFLNGTEVSRKTSMSNTWTTVFNKTDGGSQLECGLQHYTLPERRWPLVTCGQNITMTVEYPPEVEIGDESERQLTEGETYHAECQIKEYGNPRQINEMYWIGPDGDVYLHNQTLLTIKKITRRERGEYTCVMTNQLYDGRKGVGNVTVFVDVQYIPSVNLTPTEVAAVVVGKPFQVDCEVDANPAANISWQYPDDNVVIHDDIKLVINKTTKQHQGTYTCEARNTLFNGVTGDDSDNLYLDVQFAPELSVDVSGDADPGGSVIEGKSASINCNVYAANPDIDSIGWLSEGGVLLEDSGNLAFVDINRSQDGKYICKAVNTFWDGTNGTTTVDKDINVQYFDSITVKDASNYKVIEGQTYQANCSSTGNPQPQISWIYPNGSVIASHNLVVHNDGKQDAKFYQVICNATSVFWDGTHNNDVSVKVVEVQFKPELELALSYGSALSQGDNVTVIEGKPLAIDCIVIESNPVIHWISWSSSQSAGEWLNFTSVARQDEAIYTCSANNTFWDDSIGSSSIYIGLYVQYAPAINITDNNGFVEVEGRTYTVYCNSKANPKPNVYWEIIDESVIESDVLVIERVTRQQSGQYQCFAVNTFWDDSTGSNSATFVLDVQYPPTVIVNDTIVCKEGENATAICRVVDANPKANTIEWQLVTGETQRSNVLELVDIKRSWSGDYICAAFNTYYDETRGIGTDTMRLDVQYEPDVSLDVKHIVCKEGDTISLFCDIDANPAPHMVAWVKDNSIVFSEASYTIDDIKVYQHGTYICVAVNKFYDDTDGTGSKDLEVVVEHVPFVEIEGQEQPVIEKTNMTIVCSIRDALPNPYRITLYHDDNSDVREIKTEENISGVQFVTFDTDDTDRSMNGTYYCNATTRFYDNSEDSAISDELNLIVHYPPESLLVEDRQVDAILGDKATLTCSFDAYPVATIMWTDVNGGEIASSEVLTGTVITSTVVIHEVKKSHFGDYYCLATNGIDSGILIGIELKEMRKQGVIQWLYSSAIIGGIAIGIVTVVVIFIIFVICLCRRSQEDDRRSSVSDMESLKFPPAKTTTDHSTKPTGVENLGMVRTAPDGTIDHGGITNSEETVMSTFKPKITNKKGETDNTAKTTTGKPPGVTLLKDIQK